MHILYLDNHILVLNKPAGILTQPNHTNAPSLESFGKKWLQKRFSKSGNIFLQAVHRLDREVSGIVLFARTSKAITRLNQSQRSGLFQKTYKALISGFLDKSEGFLEHFLKKGNYRSCHVTEGERGAKKCVLKYHVEKKLNGCSLVKISLLTGRYHQIRAQFSEFGHPIIGDRKYSSQIDVRDLFLHHETLVFPHPITKQNIVFSAPLPEHWYSRIT
jgi:23S rRNA pseudouridine1911/1915/1917 synthase